MRRPGSSSLPPTCSPLAITPACTLMDHVTVLLLQHLVSCHQLPQLQAPGCACADQQLSACRPYTPVTDDDTPGRVEFVIKVYPSGKMTQIMDKMKVGDSMLMKGPRGRFQYTRNMKRAIGEDTAAPA